MLTQALLLEIAHYDPALGVFTSHQTGKAMGWLSSHGRGAKKVVYIRVSIGGKSYYAHRLAVLYMTGAWPKAEVDHEDKDGLNNRWANLREATHSQNGHNQGLRVNNKSGVKGVSWDTGRGKWHATITINGREKGLGRFDTLEAAAEARRNAEAEYHGAFAHIAGSA